MPDYLPYSLSQFEKKSTILFPQEGEKKTKLSNIKKTSSNNKVCCLTKGTIRIADSH